VGKIARTARKALNSVLGFAGFRLVRFGESDYVMAFQPFRRTINGAKKAGLSVGDYIDSRFQVRGATQDTIDRLASLGTFGENVRSTCEIGPGSGRYLEKVQRLCASSSYEIYETDLQWSDWLARTYHVAAREASGRSLRDTENDSIDLVHAHKVFVYLPLIVTCQYFAEMIRVTRPGGQIVFDIISEGCMADSTLEKWIASGLYFPCMMPREFTIAFFARQHCTLQASFFAPLVPGQSEYLIFAKDKP
jgi:hypothetical protein